MQMHSVYYAAHVGFVIPIHIFLQIKPPPRASQKPRGGGKSHQAINLYNDYWNRFRTPVDCRNSTNIMTGATYRIITM